MAPLRQSILRVGIFALLGAAACGGGSAETGPTTTSGKGGEASGGSGGATATAAGGSGGTSTGSGGAGGGTTTSTSSTSTSSTSSSTTSSSSTSSTTTPVVLDDAYVLPDDQYPESGSYDAVNHAFLLSSLKYGDVWRVDADGTQGVFYPATGEPDRLTLGVKVDATRRRVWVCSIINDSAKPGDVWAIDADSGLLLAEFALGDTYPGASCNDLALDAQGRAYVTDRENPNVYRIDLDALHVSVWATGPLLEPGVVGMNGIAFTPDGAKLIVTQYLSAKLIAISTAAPSQMAAVQLSGDAFSGGFKVANGADGIVFHGQHLYVAFGDNVMRVTPTSAAWASATVKAQEIGTGYTAVTVAEGDLYAIRGHAVSFQFGLSPDLPFQILRVDTSAF